ncbi:hypothetical protein [Bacillus sp. JCM 19041]|uniref:hypothetical protein n=1 Tax=Bacillus sp. JCM 19041 TaxID=1460637 RepID=UPI003369CC32
MLIAVLVLPHLSVLNNYHTGVKWMLILLVPVITFSSVARGYLIGAQHTSKIAIANLLKRAAQLIGLLVVFNLFSLSSDLAIFMALLALKLSELLVLFYLVIVFIRKIGQTKKSLSAKTSKPKRSSKKAASCFVANDGTSNLSFDHLCCKTISHNKSTGKCRYDGKCCDGSIR